MYLDLTAKFPGRPYDDCVAKIWKGCLACATWELHDDGKWWGAGG